MIPASALDAPELAALLHFYAEAGVEWLVEDEAIDSFAAFARARAEARPASSHSPAPSPSSPQPAPARTNTRSPAPPPPAAAARPVVVPNEEAVAEARAAAAAARSLDELKQALLAFNGCNLKLSALSTIFASGDPSSGVMIVGPMPEQDDEREGVAFAGPPGFLLDRMIGAIGLSRETVLMTTLIPWRTPGNRPPAAHEIEICRPFIHRQIELAEPRALLLLGNLTARFFLGANGNIHRLRGSWHEIGFAGRQVPALASLHPSELLKAPASKALAWADLLAFGKRIGTI